jgi:dienelactone hydrolase
MPDSRYSPFGAGQFGVEQPSFVAADKARGRMFPVDLWQPAPAGASPPCPLVVFVHGSGGNRRSAAYACSHLASHGYLVAAMDHSEVVAADLAPAPDENAGQRAARVDAIIASRVPDVRFLLDVMLNASAGGSAGGSAGQDAVGIDADRIGLVGHSFGGWTVLAVPEQDARIGAVVALGPGGNSNPLPGILPLSLTFAWGRDIPVLYLAAADDVPIPLGAVQELFDRTSGRRHMFVLRRADHQHFLDDVESEHEALRAMTLPGDAAWIPGAMRPMSELCSGAQAHDFVRGLTLAHLDATLRQSEAAERFLASGAEAALAAEGVDATEHGRC